MTKTAIEEEKLKSFRTLLHLYEKAAPIIKYISNIEALQRGELPFSPHILLESSITLRMILDTVNKMPEPKDGELANIKWEFQKALYNCIRAAEAAEKYLERGNDSSRSEIILNSIINSTVLAHEYIESISHRLDRLYPIMNTIMILYQSKSVYAGNEIEHKESKKLVISEKEQNNMFIFDSIASAIEFGLDKLGDLIIFVIDRPVAFFSRIIRYFRKLSD